MTTTQTFHYTITSIKEANKEAGDNFFSPSTMRFWGSRVLRGVYGGRFFVTSEHTGFDRAGRAYTVRMVKDDGRISTVGEFLGHATIYQARKAAKAAAGE